MQLEEANEAFDQVYQLKPDAYLWQAGIAKFYLGDIEAAAEIFAKNAEIYETKFGTPASEERIWRDACELKYLYSMKKKDRTDLLSNRRQELEATIAQIPDLEEDPDSLFAETRKVIRIARDLFTSTIQQDHTNVIISRAKLRSIGGNFEDQTRFDIKQWKLNAWYYLGLHYDAISEKEESKECMKMALRSSQDGTGGNGNNIVLALPLIHMSERDWFDDDDMDVNPLKILGPSNDNNGTEEQASFREVDPLFYESIRKSIQKMRFLDLQDALRVRGIKCTGPKEKLQKRLLNSLMDDTGLLAP